MNKETFIEELKKINIEITEEQLQKLEKYYEILVEENKKINLTSITEKKEVYLKHFYDSLTLTKAIDLNTTQTLCDVGTGAGFPGIVLKIMYPNLKITLIDSQQKRVKFLKETIKKLELTEIEAIHTRMEEYTKITKEKFDIITSRAVANTNVLLEIGANSLKIDGYFILMKANATEEIKKMNHALKELNLKKEQIIEFSLPIENSIRTLIKIRKVDRTPNKYPRDFIKIKKKTL